MCYISTLIDLNLGKLFVESPRCKEKLQIELKSSRLVTGRDEMDIQNHRFQLHLCFLPFVIKYLINKILFK